MGTLLNRMVYENEAHGENLKKAKWKWSHYHVGLDSLSFISSALELKPTEEVASFI